MIITIKTPEEIIANAFTEKAPDGVSVKVKHPIIEFVENWSPEYTVILQIGRDVAISLLASWLYDKLKNSKSQATSINGQKTFIKIVEIRKIVITIMEEEKGDPSDKQKSTDKNKS